MRTKELIKRYKKIYKEVNKKDISVSYYSGWYCLGARISDQKYRASDIIRMCEVLEARKKTEEEYRS